MLVALAVLAALEATPASAAVELTRAGAAGAPVSAAPRTLADVAREMREGRRAVGGFSAVETTVSRGPVVLPAFEWADEDMRSEPEVAPEPEPPGDVVPFVSGYGGWYGGGWGGAPHRRPPHVRHHGPSSRPGPRPGNGSSMHGGGPRIQRPAAQPPAGPTQAGMFRRR